MGMADTPQRFPPGDDSATGLWYGCDGGTVALPQHNPPMTLDEAVAELRRDPLHSVHAHVDGLEVELRVVAANERPEAAEDALGGAGPWVGETTEEILQVMQEFRRDDGREPPRL